MATDALTCQDYQDVLKDIGIRLISMSDVIKHILGRSVPAVGMTAGRVAARHLPYSFRDVDGTKVLENLQALMRPAWRFEYQVTAAIVEATFRDCAVREIYRRENRELGGDLCTLFHGYLSGLLSELSGKKYPVEVKSVGEVCELKFLIRD
jgi:hypothetical protein